jgi:hypothetical protein
MQQWVFKIFGLSVVFNYLLYFCPPLLQIVEEFTVLVSVVANFIH